MSSQERLPHHGALWSPPCSPPALQGGVGVGMCSGCRQQLLVSAGAPVASRYVAALLHLQRGGSTEPGGNG